jgi:glycosyltransferase involved in cell wall biosynthesis
MQVALIGWAAPTGLGSLNRDFANCDWVHRWLAPNHPKLGIEVPPAPPRKAETAISPWPVLSGRFQWLVDGADVLLFAEIPYVNCDLLRSAKAKRVKLVCVPMTDQLRWESEWIGLVDLFYCPTKFALTAMETVRQRRLTAGLPAGYQTAGGWWGVDLERFKFRQRTICNRFLFVNGWGGVAGRKGLQCLLAAAPWLPPRSVTVVSQRALGPLPEAFVGRPGVSSNNDLYDFGDVLLAPSRFEGLGLQYYEAMASGLPVAVTDAEPMNECSPHRLIAAERQGKGNGCNPVYNACSRSLADVVNELHGKDISEASMAARANVEARHDVRALMSSLRESLTELVAGPSTPQTA